MILGLRDPLVLSPMVDVTDAAFRSVAREWGADVACSEMVSAAGLVHGNAAAWRHVAPWPGEAPYGVQLMGGSPEEMAQAVRLLVARVPLHFIDVNLGCPSPNILRACAGGFLLRDPPLAGRVIRAAVEAAEAAGPDGPVPVSVKMRLGPDAGRHTYLDVAREAEAAGAAWCTLHARTVEQGYSGTADWSAIGRLVDAVGIPVVGNGDLRAPEDVVRMRDETGCAGFFIARAAMHDPTVFRRMRQALDGAGGSDGAGPSMAERLATLERYVARAQAAGIADVPLLRRQAMRFVAGAPGAKALRLALHEARTLDALLARVAQARAAA